MPISTSIFRRSFTRAPTQYGIKTKIKASPKAANFNSRWSKVNRDFYEKWSQLASSFGGDCLAFSWAIAEATFWPIIPDFLIAPLAVGDVRKASYRSLVAASLGSSLGAVLLFQFAKSYPQYSHKLLKQFPLVHDYYFEQVQQKLENKSLLAFLFQPWSGIPAKVWVVVLAKQPSRSFLALPLLILGRISRMAMSFFMGKFFASVTRRFLHKFSIPITIWYLLTFFYSWWQVVKKRNPK